MRLSDIKVKDAVATERPESMISEEPPIRMETVLYTTDKYIGTDSGTYLISTGDAVRGRRTIRGVVLYISK